MGISNGKLGPSSTTGPDVVATKQIFVVPGGSRNTQITSIFAAEDEIAQRGNPDQNQRRDRHSCRQDDHELGGEYAQSFSGDGLSFSVLPEDNRLPKPNVPKEMDENENKSIREATKGPSRYIESYLKLMFAFGTCKYRTELQRQLDRHNCLFCTRKIVQTILFFFIVVMSSVISICNAKFCILYFLDGKGYNFFVMFVHDVTCIIIILTSVYIFSSKHEKIDKMLSWVAKYDKDSGFNNDDKLTQGSFRWDIPIFLSCGTFVLGVIRAVFGYGPDIWSVEQIILMASYQMSEDIFIWDSKHLNETSAQLFERYGTNVNTKTATLGAAKVVGNIASYTQLGMIWDLILVVSLVIYIMVMPFVKQILVTMENPPESDVQARNELQKKRENVWEKYRQLKETVQAINDVFDSLLKLFHIANVLMYAYFMALCLYDENIAGITYVHIAYNLSKAEVAYVLAARVAEQNFVVRKWIRRWAFKTGTITVKSVEMDAGIILSEIEDEPIGLGKGNFLVHESFHFKFLGLVGSLYFSLADDMK